MPYGNDFVAIAAGSLHNLALRHDGRIEAWGEDNYGQCDVPEGNDFAVIAAGDFHSLAIRDSRKRFVPVKVAEPQITETKPPEDQTATPAPVPETTEPVTSPGATDVAPPEETQDPNALPAEEPPSQPERAQPVAVKETEPVTTKKPETEDPNTGANAQPPKTAQKPDQTEPAAAAPTQSKDPGAARTGPAAEPAKPSAATAAEPNKPVLNLESAASQGFAPSIYMGVIENASPVYDFVSTITKRHFCTISEEEKYKLLDERPSLWKYQGIAFFAYAEGNQPKDARPVYRFWSESLGQYFYTLDEVTKDMIIKDLSNVWKYQGIAWYAPPIRQPGQKK